MTLKPLFVFHDFIRKNIDSTINDFDLSTETSYVQFLRFFPPSYHREIFLNEIDEKSSVIMPYFHWTVYIFAAWTTKHKRESYNDDGDQTHIFQLISFIVSFCSTIILWRKTRKKVNIFRSLSTDEANKWAFSLSIVLKINIWLSLKVTHTHTMPLTQRWLDHVGTSRLNDAKEKER